MAAPKYSVIVPVYNRPDELRELLDSLTFQTFKDFEVIIVDDGSDLQAAEVVKEYSSQLAIRYFFKTNTGPGPSRNFGFDKADGEYFVMFDSDCIIPLDYFSHVEAFITTQPLDAWGGPDRGNEKFTVLQQAMAYTMQSFWTTGGIRGGKNQAANFQPRSFNMGFSRKVWEKTRGFAFDRLAEDIELSIRMKEAGFVVALIPDAFVYHKRRTNLWQFFKQVEGFGRGRVRVGKVHPGAVKLAHWFPTAFLIYFMFVVVAVILQNPWREYMGAPLYFYLFLISISCFLQNISAVQKKYKDEEDVPAMKSIRVLIVAVLTIPAAIVQLTGYGLGFLKEKVGL